MSEAENYIINIFRSYKAILIRALLRMSVNPTDVDDILQESLVRTLQADRQRRVSFPKSYLYMVARNIVLEESERRSREVQCEINEAIISSNAPPLDEELYYKDMLAVFWTAMSTLPKNQQRAILLRRIYGLSHKEIAKKMGISISSVEKYFAQGIKRCQDVMSGDGYGVENLEETAARRIGAEKTPARPHPGGKGLPRD